MPYRPTRRGALRCAVVLAVLGLVHAGCGMGPLKQTRARRAGIDLGRGADGDGRGPMNEAELTQRLERMASQFLSDLHETGEPLVESLDGRDRTTAARQIVAYGSSVLDIATGPEPETNLLDMIVFAELSAKVMAEHWIPTTFGAKGRPMLDALESLDRDAWAVAESVLTTAQEEKLRTMIDTWKGENGGRVHVEGLRFGDFALVSGAAAAARAADARGLLGSLKSGVQAADRALLLGERSLFLLQRLPFMVRAHVRVFELELRDHAAAAIGELGAAMASAEQLEPMLEDVSALLAKAQRTSSETRALAEEMGPLVDRAAALVESGKLERTLATTDRVTERTLTLVRELRAMDPGEPDVLAAVEARAERMIRRAMLYAALAGAFVSVVFWAGYVVARRAIARS